MQRFKNILVCQDAMAEDTLALNRAAKLARHNNAQLKVIDVMEDMPNLRARGQYAIRYPNQ